MTQHRAGFNVFGLLFPKIEYSVVMRFLVVGTI